jgi:hypothetical protein
MKLTWGRVHNTSVSLLLVNGPNKLECYITLDWKGFPDTKRSSLLGSLISYEKINVVNKAPEHFIFFVTNK